MSNQWFRLYAEFATDPKVQMMSEQLQRRFIMLLCLRCNVSETFHETYSDEEIAFQLRISNEEWAETKATFVAKKLIDENNNPTAWDKRQYVSDSSTSRVKKYRNKLKRECNVSETPPDTDTDTDTDTELDTSANADVVGSKLPTCPHKKIIELYAKNLPELAQPKIWDGNRQQNLAARWKWVLTAKKSDGAAFATDHESALNFFDRFFAYVAKSDFLTGRSKDWQCDLSWLVKANNFAKVIEGAYERKEAA